MAGSAPMNGDIAKHSKSMVYLPTLAEVSFPPLLQAVEGGGWGHGALDP